MEDLKKLVYFAKKLIDKNTMKKIGKIKEKEDREQALKYTIALDLERRYGLLESKLSDIPKEHRDTFIVADTKIHLIKPKIKIFQATLDKKDFERLMRLIKEVEKDLV